MSYQSKIRIMSVENIGKECKVHTFYIENVVNSAKEFQEYMELVCRVCKPDFQGIKGPDYGFLSLDSVNQYRQCIKDLERLQLC